MKILLDENIPKRLRFDFGSAHQVFTARQMRWNGKKNGELLGLMTLHRFEVLITMDKNIEHQQNLDQTQSRLSFSRQKATSAMRFNR